MGNMCDSFIIYEDNQNEFKIWQGLVGAHYTPHVDDVGNLSWTNNGDLPNPPTVNIAGRGLNIVGIVDTDTDLPETANNFDTYLVGTEDPYSAYIYDDGTWYNLGIVGQGEKGDPGDPGVGVPTGGTTGQVLKKASSTDYDTEWGSVEALPTGGTTGQVLSKTSNSDYDVGWESVVIPTVPDPATATPLMDGTAAVGTATKYAREDHVHPTDTSRASATDVSNLQTTVGGITPKTASLTIAYANWSGSDPYTQTITISGATITSNTKVDLQMDATALAQLISDGVSAMFVSNTSGTLTLYAIGAATTANITVQVTYYETA